MIICTGLIAASLPPVSNYFVAGLENKFPALQQLPEDTGAVLVLGYGHNYAIDRPVNSILTAGALARLTEGVRLWKTRPQSLLIVSGSGYRSPVSHAQVMMETAVTFGVPADKIIRLDHTRDTAEEMRAVNDILQQQAIIEKRLVVVSSATHLPRAEMLIQPLEIPYTMAPTDYLASRYPWYFPGSGSLHHLDRVVHEWMGMLWIKLNRAIQSTS